MKEEHILMELSNYYHSTHSTHTLQALNPGAEMMQDPRNSNNWRDFSFPPFV